MMFRKNKSHAEKMREDSYKASLKVIIGWIEAVARNGHFSYTIDIRRNIGEPGLAKDIVQRMKTELEGKNYGYIVTVEEDKNRMVINW